MQFFFYLVVTDNYIYFTCILNAYLWWHIVKPPSISDVFFFHFLVVLLKSMIYEGLFLLKIHHKREIKNVLYCTCFYLKQAKCCLLAFHSVVLLIQQTQNRKERINRTRLYYICSTIKINKKYLSLCFFHFCCF